MIRTLDGMPQSFLENEQNGHGRIDTVTVFSADDLQPQFRMCKRFIFHPGDSIGPHTHHQESELYYILSGEAVVIEDGIRHCLKAGEAALCPDGHTHSIVNESDREMQMLAIIA